MNRPSASLPTPLPPLDLDLDPRRWLANISVTTEESDNFFHFNDNRVLPEHVTAEIANAEGCEKPLPHTRLYP